MEHTCEYCDKQFSSKSSLNHHIKTAKICINSRQTNDSGITTQKCDFCKKEFHRKDNLTSHLKICPEMKKQESEKILEDFGEAKKKIHALGKELDSEKHSNDKLRKENIKLKENIKKLKEKNRKLKEDKINLSNEVNNKKGFIEGFTTSKPPQTITNNTNNNTTNNISSKVLYRLSDIDTTKVEPLTKATIKIKTKDYGYVQFQKREKGVADLIENSATYKNNDSEKASLSYAFVDGYFYKVNENRVWELDENEEVISTFLNELKPRIGPHYNQFLLFENNANKPKIDPFKFLPLKSDPPEKTKYNRDMLEKYHNEQKNLDELDKSEEFAAIFLSNQGENGKRKMEELHTQVKSQLEPRLRR